MSYERNVGKCKIFNVEVLHALQKKFSTVLPLFGFLLMVPD